MIRRVIGPDNREWVIQTEIQWKSQGHNFECEPRNTFSDYAILILVWFLFFIVILMAPSGIPALFIIILYVLLIGLPPFLFINNRPRKLSATCEAEYWEFYVSGHHKAKHLTHLVIKRIKEKGQPEYILERVY